MSKSNEQNEPKKYLTRDDILSADDLVREEVPVPEWGGVVLVQALNGEDRDKYESSIYNVEREGKEVKVKYTNVNVKARLAAYSIVDESGQRIFSDADIARLGKKSAAALNRVVDVCQRLSGITKKDMDDLEKNSEATTSEDSPSA